MIYVNLSINTRYSIWKLLKNKRFKALHTRFYVQPNMQKKLNAVGYGDTCNNNINIFYTCIRIAKKRNRYRVVIKDIHLIFWNTVSNLWDFFKHLIFFSLRSGSTTLSKPVQSSTPDKQRCCCRLLVVPRDISVSLLRVSRMFITWGCLSSAWLRRQTSGAWW